MTQIYASDGPSTRAAAAKYRTHIRPAGSRNMVECVAGGYGRRRAMDAGGSGMRAAAALQQPKDRSATRRLGQLVLDACCSRRGDADPTTLSALGEAALQNAPVEGRHGMHRTRARGVRGRKRKRDQLDLYKTLVWSVCNPTAVRVHPRPTRTYTRTYSHAYGEG